MDGPINKGELMSHNLTELLKPESYEVRLTPITRFGEGDSTIRIVRYSGESLCERHSGASTDAAVSFSPQELNVSEEQDDGFIH